MAADTGRVVLVMMSFGFAAVVPIVGGSLWSAWRTSVEQRQILASQQGAPELPEGVAAEPAPAPPPAPAGPVTAERMFSFVSELTVTPETRADALPDQPFRIALQGDDGGLPTGATVDVGRDGTIDEVWTLARGSAPIRELRPAGGEPKRLTMVNGAWMPEGTTAPPPMGAYPTEQPPSEPPAEPGAPASGGPAPSEPPPEPR